MKALVFGDTHGVTNFSYLLSKAQDVDVVLCIGDVSDFGVSLVDVLVGLESFAKKLSVPLVITHGNHEGNLASLLAKHAPSVKYVHESFVQVNDIVIVGFGGGGFRQQDPQVMQFFSSLYENNSFDDAQVVWLFHGPPFDCEIDFVDWAGSTGCKTKRAAIKRYQPDVVCAGHIHEQWGVQSRIGDSLLINPGPDGVVVEITRK